MIKFFRKIRQNLLSEGKTGKYFKYAIGEIVLVMVGILLALQVNNWNENRKENQLKLQLLKELQFSAKDDFERGQYQLSMNKKALSSIELIINHLENNIPYNDSLKNHFTLAHTRWISQVNDDAYQNITDYGLNFMKNETTRIKITNLYGINKEFLEKLDERFNLFYYQVAAPVLIDCFDQIIPPGFSYTKMTPLDYQELAENENYRSVLNSTKSYLEVYIYWQEKFISNNLGEIGNLLDAEIKYFEKK
ncbi:MAG: hypothetical protein HWE09_04440 [Cyclobacteriaceae bacterium]|nr:hypothetical protein [Cyclobacteriaceae bacterium]